MTTLDDITAAVTSRFSEVQESQFRGQSRLVVTADQLLETARYLKQEQSFDMLVDITCVDYLHYRGATDRFGLVVLLANTTEALRLTLRVMLNEPRPTVTSLTSLWQSANWLEREVWDMFGIHFEGHPDLRRILLPEAFTTHPLRKDYPLQGHGERHNFPVIRRADA
ncbi:MAG: NADH-quinone oxidoreductase subunit C [Pirellulaceae bacterium]|nr:NADH-quinone oxidoreductase subunit C [Pirellulaceae bacterium]